MFPLQVTVANPARIGLDLVGIAAGAPLDLDLRVESVSEGVLVSGTVSAPITGECARCLTPLQEHIEVDVTELFAYPDSLTEATTEDDEVGRVIADTVDLEQPIIDAVGLELSVFAGMSGRLSRALPDVRRRTGDRRAGPSPRRDRPALGETDNNAGV